MGSEIYKRYYELPLSKDYVRHWGMPEAVREIIQNALDSDSPFEYELDESEGVLRVHSRHTTLTPNTLLLGKTTKADRDDKIGSFGEGYKIALLVLCRENYKVRVLNGDRIWKPGFVMSRIFQAEVLRIEDHYAMQKNEGLTFEVAGLSAEDIQKIRASCLHMQSDVGQIMQTQYGRILLDLPGKLYVGGLFVCDTDLTYGYDVLPKYLRLERDRQTVSGWDMKSITKEMWFDTKQYDQIANLLAEKTPDLEYAEYGAPDLVKEACYRHFREQHPGAVIAKDQQELERLVESGMQRVIVIGGAYGSLVKESASYASRVIVPVLSPHDQLEGWFEANKKRLLPSLQESFQIILEKSKRWRNS